LALTINPRTSTSEIGRTQKALQQNLERLSSARRINSAADDSAGLSISQKLKAFESAANQGARNLSDGISAVRVAEGGLNETSNNLTRLRELAVQAQNGTLGDSERSVIQQEFDAITAEINRTSQTTEFNGKQLLNGDTSGDGAIVLEDGQQNGEDVAISVDDQSASSLGIQDLDITDPGTVDAIDGAQDQISSARADLGSTENRLSSQIRSLSIQAEAAAEAESRVADTDFAQEAAEQTKNQILQQFQVALRGQANASAGIALQLLNPT